MDLAKPEMRALIDLRNKPQFMQAVTRGYEGYPQAPDQADHGGRLMAQVEQADGRISTH
ncbi:MAG: hypothetical protein K0S81_3842 [Rhodospirillales bacterium]|nr:hypothetical protein [Rhodospirillales bacterium]